MLISVAGDLRISEIVDQPNWIGDLLHAEVDLRLTVYEAVCLHGPIFDATLLWMLPRL